MKKFSRGFTIVELTVVIVIIGILSTIGVVSFDRYQSGARDSVRSAEQTAMSEALEKYYSVNGEYPGCSAIQSPASINAVSTTLQGLDATTLTAPNAAAGTNSYGCTSLTSGSGTDRFAYVGDGSTTCLTGSSCLQYTLQYREESTGNIISLASRHSVQIATSGAATVNATAAGFAQVNLSWTTVPNALTYTVAYSTMSDFSSNVVTPTGSPFSGTSASITGLTQGQTYYFRVAANTTNNQGGWSNVTGATTWTLTAPTISSTSVTPSTFTANWGSIAHAATYTTECSADNASWSTCSASGVTALTYTFYNATAGFRYYIHVRAENGSYIGPWSASVIAITSINAPAAFSISSSSTYNTLTATANSACADSGTTATYKWYANGSLWVSGTQYRSVGYTIGNGSSVTLTVSVACTTSYTSSSYTASNNSVSLSWAAPTASIGTISYRTIAWSGSCPSGTTSMNFYWRLSGGAINASGNTATGGTYSNTGVAWGDGGANVTLTCYGPWGSIQGTGWSAYGAGCVPTVTTSACYG